MVKLDDSQAESRRGLDGARAQAKQRTATQIIEVSLRLFRQEGFDVVTTEQIAREAGVTQRTLFRHFARKEQILYEGDYDYVARFERFLDEAMRVWDDPGEAIRSAFRSLTAYFDANRERISAIYAIIQASPQLTSVERGHQSRIDRLVACALDGREAYLARTTTPSLHARIEAAVLFATIRPMFRAWLNGELTGELRLYAEVGWANVEPVRRAAQAYADAAAAGFERIEAAQVR